MDSKNYCALGLSLAALAGSAASAQDRLFLHDGDLPDSGVGYAVSGLGDVDLDGVRDYLIGSMGCVSSNAGFAEVVSGATGALIRTHTGDGCFGMSVADLGDVDQDGVSDYAISSIRENSAIVQVGGRVRIYSGVDGSLIRVLEGDAFHGRFGLALDAPGDLDLDGNVDLLVSSPWDSTHGYQAGSADVFSGTDFAAIRHFDGDKERDWFGWSAAGVGDVDADGVADLVVGAPYRWYGGDGSEPPGYARLFSGRTALEIRTHGGSAIADHFGTSVAGVGDLDGDGVGDVALGAPWHRVHDFHGSGPAEIGAAEVRSGATGALIHGWLGKPDSRLGTSVRPAGDFDGDGVGDVLVSACFCHNTTPVAGGEGWFEVRSGATGERLAQVDDGEPYSSFGYAVAPLGDITADGVVDFLVGSPYDDAQGLKTGAVRAYSGADLLLHLDVHELSVAAGGVQTLTVDAGPAFAGATYVVAGSASGTSPGFDLGSVHVPLVPDEYSLLLLDAPQGPTHAGTLGVLDDSGAAAATITLPAGLLPPSSAGLVLHHAAVVLGAAAPELASLALPLNLVP